MTVEDPVEYELDGIKQVQVNPKAGLTFATGLRSMLRADPDVMMVGEIRDRETAQIAIESALTGHLVLTTLHTNDAPLAAARLVEMGIEPYLVDLQRRVRGGAAARAEAVRLQEAGEAEQGSCSRSNGFEVAARHLTAFEPVGCVQLRADRLPRAAPASTRSCR